MVKQNEGRTALVELSFAFMGVLKLTGLEAGLFRRWGLTRRQMRNVGAVETLGALMVANPPTRSLGALGLATISAVMLVVEVRNRETELVLPRLALTALAAMTALAAGQALAQTPATSSHGIERDR